MKIRKRTWTHQGKKSQGWQLDWRDEAGRHRRLFRTQREAELFQKKLIREGYTEEYGELLPPITLEAFIDVYAEKKPWKTESYRARVLSTLGIVPFRGKLLTEVTRQTIEDYRDARAAKPVSPSTLRQDLAALADCFGWAVRLGYLRKNPVSGVEKPSLPVKQDDPARYMSVEQFGDLLAVAGPDVKLFIFAAWTGLRITELLALEWADVHGDYVLVRRGKGRKQRMVPLLPAAKASLENMAKSMLRPTKVFGWAGDRHTVLRRFQRRCQWAGLPRFRFHDLRHTFGAWAASSGVDLEVIAAALGHSSTTVTKLYAHLSPEYKRRELEKMIAGTRRAHAGQKSAKELRGHPS